MASNINLNKADDVTSSEAAESSSSKCLKMLAKNNPDLMTANKQCLLCGKWATVKCVCSYAYCSESCKVSDWAHHIKICHKMPELSGELEDNGDSDNESSCSSTTSDSSFSDSPVEETTDVAANNKFGKTYVYQVQKPEIVKYMMNFFPASKTGPKIPDSSGSVVITMFVSLNTFYIRSITQNCAYSSLYNALQKYAYHAHDLLYLPKVGDILITRRGTFSYARVFVTDVQDISSITCFYMDYGNTVIKTLKELKFLNLELQRAQRFILKTRLKHVPNYPMFTLPAELIGLLTSMFNCTGIVEYEGSFTNGKEVELFTGPQRKSFNKCVLDMYEMY